MADGPIAVEDPRRTARVLAALCQGRALEVRPGQWRVLSNTGTIAEFTGAVAAGGQIVHLRVKTALPVERIIELACEHGFHAEPTWASGALLIEFWIDEKFLFEVRTPESGLLEAAKDGYPGNFTHEALAA